VNVLPVAKLGNVIDGMLPQDIQPELETPNTAEEFKLAIEKGALKRSPEEDGIVGILYK
jgi:hypothetical protein